jgi:hypothetical protein
MQNNNTHDMPVGTVSYNEVTEGTTMDGADDEDFLLFMSSDVFFPSASDMSTSPNRLLVRKL